MRVTRWIVRAVAGLLALVLLVVVAALLALQTEWARERIRTFAVERANAVLNAQLSIGHLGGSLLRGVELSQVSLTQDGRPLFAAELVVVSYDPIVLARQGLRLDRITVHRPVVHVIETPHGWNVTQLVRPRPTPRTSPPAFSIRQLTLLDGDVTVRPARAAARHLSDVDAELSLRQDQAGLATTVTSLSALDEGSTYRIERLTGSFDGAFANVDTAFSAISGSSRVAGTLQGRDNASGRQFSGEFDLSQLDLSDLLSDPRWASDVTGHATMRATMPQTGTSAITFSFAGPHASAFDYEGRDLDVTGTWSDGRLTFAGKANGYGAALTIDAAWQITEVPGVTHGFRGTGSFAHADLRRLPAQLPLPPFASSLSGRFTLRYHANGWAADTILSASRFEDATLAGGTTGRIDVRGGGVSYAATGRLSGLNVRQLAGPLEIPALGDERLESRLNGSFTAEGSGTDPVHRHLAATVTLEDSVVAGAKFGAVDLGVTLEGPQLDVTANGDFAQVSALVAWLPSSVSMDLAGRTNVRVTIPDLAETLTLDTVNVFGRVDLGASTVQGVPLTSAVIDADLTHGLATIRDMHVEGRGLSLAASGTAALGTCGASDLELKAHTTDLRALGDQLTVPLAGAADLVARITGPADHPVMTGMLNGQTLAYGNTARALTLNTTFMAELPGRDVRQAIVHGDVDAAFVQASGFELVSVRAKAGYANQQLSLESHLEQPERTVDLEGVIALGEGGRDVTLRQLQVTSAGAVWSLPAGREAHVRLEPTLVRVDRLAFTHGDGSVDISGVFPLVPEAAAPTSALDVRVTHVQVADLNQLLLGTRTLEGVVDGTARVAGSLKAPEVAATLAITAGAVEGVHFDALRGKVTYAGDRATVDGTLDQTSDNRLTVTGVIPVSSGGAPSKAGLDLRVTSTPIDLGLAQALTQEVTAIAGLGTFNVAVTGSLQDPILDGDILIDHAGFTITGTGVTYKNTTARLRVVSNRLQIGQFLMQDDDGHELRAAGGLDVFGKGSQGTLDLALTAKSFHMLDSKMGNVQVNADVTISGDVAHPRISGQLRVDQGRIEVDRVLEITTKNVYSTRPQAAEDDPTAAPPAPSVSGAEEGPVAGAAAPVPPTPSLLDRLDLDLRVTLPDNLVLRGRDLRMAGSSMGLGDMNIVAGGTLSLKKPVGAPTVIVGEMQIVRGYYSFQGRRFDVQRDSVVRFRGRSPIDPQLDVTADREISGVVTSVNIQGTASRPQIDFSSQPPLDDADVLSLIVFGQSVNDLGGAQRSSLSEKAASMAAGAIATPIADSVARALNLDLFEIQAPADSRSAPVVSLGSQIGTRLYVGVKQEVGRGDRSSSLSVEYRIASFLRLVTSIAQGAAQKQAAERGEAGGIDLMFVFRY